MEEKLEKIQKFLSVCDELVDGTFHIADAKISELLRALAASRELTNLFTAVTDGFDYPAAKRAYLKFPTAAGSTRGVAYLPSARNEILAFVFCLMVEIDAGDIRLNDFLLRYFYIDGSYTASYSLFADRMLRPFRDIVRDCYPGCGSREKTSPVGTDKRGDMSLRETPVERHYIYQGKVLNLRCDDALLPNGKPCKREVVEHSGGAAVLCVREGKISLVKQFRYAYGETLYEIPAGKLNEGEDPRLAAMRELEEETGLIASELVLMFVLYPSPGYTNEKIYIYEAKDVYEGKQRLDEDEFLGVEYLPEEVVKEMIAAGEIRDAKTIAAVLGRK